MLLYFGCFGFNYWRFFIKNLTLDNDKGAISFSSAFILISFLGLIIGYILAPASKLMQFIGEKLRGIKIYEVEVGDSFNWLRIHYQDIGNITAKIRAEYTMYFSMSFVFFLFSFLTIFSKAEFWSSHKWYFSVCNFLLGIILVFRGADVGKTFKEAVSSFSTGTKLENPKDNPQKLVLEIKLTESHGE